MVSQMVIGPGSVNFIRRFVWARTKRDVGTVHGLLAGDRSRDRWDFDDIAVVADAHLGLLFPVDAADVLKEAVHEMNAELLAVRHDVDAGVLLQLEPDERRVLLRPAQRLALIAPGAPELFRFREPTWLGETAGDGGREQRERHDVILENLVVGNWDWMLADCAVECHRDAGSRAHA